MILLFDGDDGTHSGVSHQVFFDGEYCLGVMRVFVSYAVEGVEAHGVNYQATSFLVWCDVTVEET